MSLEVDHVFICPEDALGAERALADFGQQFGRRGVHRGQGTANACALFDNAYLELLWRHDDDELQSEAVRPLARSAFAGARPGPRHLALPFVTRTTGTLRLQSRRGRTRLRSSPPAPRSRS